MRKEAEQGQQQDNTLDRIDPGVSGTSPMRCGISRNPQEHQFCLHRYQLHSKAANPIWHTRIKLSFLSPSCPSTDTSRPCRSIAGWTHRGTLGTAPAAVVWTPARGRQGPTDIGRRLSSAPGLAGDAREQSPCRTCSPSPSPALRKRWLHKQSISFVARLYAE